MERSATHHGFRNWFEIISVNVESEVDSSRKLFRDCSLDEFALECFAPLHTPNGKLTNWPAAGVAEIVVAFWSGHSTVRGVIARACRSCEEVFQVFAGGSGFVDIHVEIRIAGANEKGRR